MCSYNKRYFKYITVCIALTLVLSGTIVFADRKDIFVGKLIDNYLTIFLTNLSIIIAVFILCAQETRRQVSKIRLLLDQKYAEIHDDRDNIEKSVQQFKHLVMKRYIMDFWILCFLAIWGMGSIIYILNYEVNYLWFMSWLVVFPFIGCFVFLFSVLFNSLIDIFDC